MNYQSYIRSITLVFVFFVQFTYAQIAVTNNPPFDNEANIVTDVLLGSGIVASNFSSVGFANGIGYFDGFSANIGFEEGVILSTGGLEMVTNGFGIGSGVSGDSDLELALNEINLTWNVNNVTILEFDFIAESESMAFNYVFGSTEYTSFTCSSYNDIFGFFLSGPGITGPYSNNAINLALVPDPTSPGSYTNTPVAVNTINAGSPTYTNNPTCDAIDPNFESYNIFWIDNDYVGAGWDGPNQPPAPEFTVQGITGFTTPLVAEYNDLICGEVYHIKLAIADAADGALNSVVFLEANSFASPDVTISTVPNTELGLVLDVDNGVLEGCGEAALQFDRGGDLSMDLNITLSYSGEATYGVDYGALPTEMILPAFQEQIILPVDVFFDDIDEGSETLIVTISGVPVPCEEDVTVQDIELVIFDQEELLVTTPNQIIIDCIGSADIQAVVEGGYPPYIYTWSNESGDVVEEGELMNEGVISINQSPEETTFYSLIVFDDCLDQIVSNNIDVIVEEQALNVSIDNDIMICQEDLSTITLVPELNGGIAPYNYTWFYNGVVISNEEVLSSLPGEGLYQIIVEEDCGDIAGDQTTISYIEPAPYVELFSDDVLDPSVLPEGCFQSFLQFTLPELMDEDVGLDFYITGSASLSDYNIESTTVTIPAGEESVLIPISIYVDQEQEGVEDIIFNFPFIDECSDWPDQIIIQIYEPPTLSVQVPDQLILCEDQSNDGLLEGFFNGGVGLVNYGWYYEDELISLSMDLSTTNLNEGLYSFIAVDECGNTASGDVNFEIITMTPTVTLSSLDYDDPSQLYEGCGNSILTFDLPYAYSQDTVFYYNILGSSTFYNGGDIAPINDFVYVPAGSTSVDINIIPLFDNYNEDLETVVFEFPFATDCVPQENIEIAINNYFPLEISLPEGQSLCVGQSLELEAEYFGGMPPYDFSWDYNGQVNNTVSSLINVEEGVNSAVFSITDGCGVSASSFVEVEGLSVDMFEVVWPPEQVVACFGDNSQINLDIEGGLPPFSFEWFLDGVATNTPSPSLPWNDDNWLAGSSQIIATMPPYTPYVYNYQVVITDSCANEMEYNIEVNIDDCIMPTTFTPNGDNNNDVFWVDFGDLVGPVSLDVFNRWGTIVYRSADYSSCAKYKSDCWDGSHFQNYGEECSEGVYYYVFTYSNPIYNVDSYDVSNFVEGVFGLPHDRSMGRQRTGNLLLVR